jgi:hypothetical protein
LTEKQRRPGALDEASHLGDPKGKVKSVVFTEEGFARAKSLLHELFGKQAQQICEGVTALGVRQQQQALGKRVAETQMAGSTETKYRCKECRHERRERVPAGKLP